MSTRQHSRKTARHNSAGRNRKSKLQYRRMLRYEPLEDRRLLAVVTVTTLGDTINFNDGVTSLREAIFATNTVPGADTIDFAPSLTVGGPATLLLTQGELAIADALTIAGPGTNSLTVDATASDTTPTFLDGKGSRIFNVDDGTANVIAVGISGLRLTGADSNSEGGAIFNRENLDLQHVTIEKNFSRTRSGAIAHVNGTLHLADSLISQNNQVGDSSFGVVSGSNSTVIIDNSIFSENGVLGSSGAISVFNTSLTITGSTFSANSGDAAIQASGGGLNIDDSQIIGNVGGISTRNVNATIVDSSVSNNIQRRGLGGIVASGGSLVITRTTISGNNSNQLGRGGGVTTINAVVSIVDSLISNNTAYFAAGTYMIGGQAFITHSTIENNHNMAGSLTRLGAGISSSGTRLQVVDSTISGNTGTGGFGIAADGSPMAPILITDSTFTGNAGGISVKTSGGAVIVNNNVIRGNTDSGIYAHLTSGGTVTITDATIVDNKTGDNNTSGRGGGIRLTMGANSTATVSESEISGNKSLRAGGGIYAYGGILAIDKTAIHDNQSGLLTSYGGGGIGARRTATTITSCRVFNNSSVKLGGGISSSGALTVKQSAVFGNSTESGGGGIWASGPLVVDNSRIANNTASRGGGIHALVGPAKITRTTIIGNSATSIAGTVGNGGGILFDQRGLPYTAGPLEVTDSTLSGNQAARGGGMYVGSYSSIFFQARTKLTLSGSTISGNGALFDGGGVWIDADAQIVHSTLTANTSDTNQLNAGTGGGLFITGGDVHLDQTIVAGNHDNTGVAPDVAGIMDASRSLIGVGASFLGPLADNGGATMTHALLPGSSAINAGDPAAVAGTSGVPVHDQRGAPFTRVYGGRIDIGAFELQSTGGLVGDFNRNGVVDAGDYVIGRKQSGSTVAPASGADANGDGKVNDADLVVWKSNFGAAQVTAGSSVVQPLPASELATKSPVASGQVALPLQVTSKDASNVPSDSLHLARELEADVPSLAKVKTPKPLLRRLTTINEVARIDLAIEAWLAMRTSDDGQHSTEAQSNPGDCPSEASKRRASLDVAIDDALAVL